MKKIEWLPQFETGAEEIDTEHRHLFGIIQEMYESIENSDYDLCAALARKFVNKLSQHFRTEEAFLTRVGYLDVEEHREHHTSVMTRARELERMCCKNNEPGKVAECYAAGVAILLDEVVRGDSGFKSYLEHHGFSRPSRSAVR